MTRARELSRLANSSALAVDSGQNVGIGSTTPDTKLDVAGIASAVAFYSDWTNVGYATVRSDLSVLSNLNVDGNVTIGGTQTVINTDVLDVADINIGIASTSSKLSNANLDGAGIKIYGSDEDKTLIWDNSNTRMSFNTDFYADNVFTTSAVVGTSATVDSQGIRVAGVVTATSFVGDGAFNNVNVTGITTASKFSGPGNIPGNVTTGTYTIVAADAGKLVSATGTVTLPAATFEVGDAISVYNNTGSDMTLTCSAPTAVYLGTDGSTKTSLTLALRCICTFVCVDAGSNGSFVAVGGGLS